MTASASTSARCSRSPSLPARPARIADSAADAPSSCQHRRWSVRGVIPRSVDSSRTARRSSASTPNPVGHPVGANAVVNRLEQGAPHRTPRGTTAPPRGVRHRPVRAPARSATVRATFSARSNPRPVSARVSTADARRSSASADSCAWRRTSGPDRCALHVDADRRVPDALSFARRLDAVADDVAPLSPLRAQQLLLGETRHPQTEVDPVEQRSGQLLLVELDAIRRDNDSAAADRRRTRTGTGWPRRPA